MCFASGTQRRLETITWVISLVKKIKYVKACPFLRDLGDSYLCVNNDKVMEVVIDPLIHIEWSEELPPVASEVPGVTTCLFTLEIDRDSRLYCTSRKMHLRMDNKDIMWEDIRDSVYLLDLNMPSEFQNAEIDFCSTCLYKVLIASSPAFQARLTIDEKISLGCSYILNKANEIYSSLIKLAQSMAIDEKSKKETSKLDKSKGIIFKQQISALNWLTWMTEMSMLDDVFASTSFEWLQKFDEWGLIVSKVADTEDYLTMIELIEESYEYAARLIELSYELIMKISYAKAELVEKQQSLLNVEKIITIAGVQFEDYMFICRQFLDIVKEEE